MEYVNPLVIIIYQVNKRGILYYVSKDIQRLA